ncbi:response regulator [Glycomyces sp. NPDC047010]|uniref:response regulator n=1 Tax=Glycomyces sp. NPDC047010 TaxID=3155023 RepID=UPI0033D9EB49
MSEAIWIELIKVLPAFLWIGFGFIALAVAKRIFTQQAPRMTKVETPWVTVELAQQAIEESYVRGPVAALPQPDWNGPLPPLPVQPGGYAPPDFAPPPTIVAPDDDTAEPARLRPMNTPPADEPGDNGAKPKTKPDEIAGPLTEPRPTTYYAPPLPGTQVGYPGAVPLAPYQQQPVYGAPDVQRSLRAASRLAFSSDLLNGSSILWVDDHPEWNKALARLFRTAGIAVNSVDSTEEAVWELRRRDYDLVISDLRRQTEPDGDEAGVKLADRMVDAGIPTPVVIFTDHARARAITHPRVAVATDSPEELVEAVIDIVGTRRSQQSQSSGSGWMDLFSGK